MEKCKEACEEFAEIKRQLAEVKSDLRKYTEQTNQQYLELLLASSRKDVTRALHAHVIADIDEGLDTGMVKSCDMRETCRSRFGEVLTGNAGLLLLDRVDEEEIARRKSELDGVRETAPYKKCNICFTEVSKLFAKEVSLMQSLRIYQSKGEQRPSITALPEEEVVGQLLDPLSNKARMQILKALYVESKTFSALSELTGLRGGNLLFHLQKLLDSGMILQKHEGGEYLITEKGFVVLNKINEVHAALKS